MRSMDRAFFKDNFDAEKFNRKLCESNALGRIGEPEEVGKAVVWLSSEDSSYITGVNLYIDGAYTILK